MHRAADEHELEVVDRRAQVLGDCSGLVEGRMGEQGRELVPADARQDVGLAQADRQDLGDAAQQLVAGGVVEQVVHRLQAVEVDGQQGRGHRVAGGVAASRRRSSSKRSRV